MVDGRYLQFGFLVLGIEYVIMIVTNTNGDFLMGIFDTSSINY